MVLEEDLVLGDVKVDVHEDDVVLGDVEEDAITCEVEALNADNDTLEGEEAKEVGKGSPPAGTAGTSASLSSPQSR